MNTVHVIGIGMSPKDLTSRHKELIDQCQLLVGGGRQLAMFKGFKGDTLTIKTDVHSLIQRIKSEMPYRRIVVLASGDPLFYGIGSVLVREISSQHLQIHPNISSVSAAFAAICQAWDDAEIISLHNRKKKDFNFDRLKSASKVAFLTSPRHGPSYIARQLLDYELTGFKFCILENIGDAGHEKISWFSDYSAVERMEYSNPNIVILLKPENPHAIPKAVSHETFIGMPDDWFTHTNGLITKAEIRALSISKLKLQRSDHVLWDIGSGSGSVSVEAGLLLPGGYVHAIEKNVDRIDSIKKNIKKFNLTNIEINEDDFPENLDKLTPPDRIFIGGGGNHLEAIITESYHALKNHGVLVVNTVVLENMMTAMTVFKKLAVEPEIIQAQISRAVAIGSGQRLKPLNPVWIISGSKLN